MFPRHTIPESRVPYPRQPISGESLLGLEEVWTITTERCLFCSVAGELVWAKEHYTSRYGKHRRAHMTAWRVAWVASVCNIFSSFVKLWTVCSSRVLAGWEQLLNRQNMYALKSCPFLHFARKCPCRQTPGQTYMSMNVADFLVNKLESTLSKPVMTSVKIRWDWINMSPTFSAC